MEIVMVKRVQPQASNRPEADSEITSDRWQHPAFSCGCVRVQSSPSRPL